MNGVNDLYLSGRIDELYEDLKYALENPQELSTKIDGKPALVIWNSFPGLNGPGVGFKSLIKQVQENRAKDYFTNRQSIYDFMKTKDLSPEEKKHRADSFALALELAPLVKPNCLLWCDVLFTENEKTFKNNVCIVKPNTVEYAIDLTVFPEVKNAKFGAVFHTVILDDFSQHKIVYTKNYLKNNEDFIICPADIKTIITQNKDLVNRLENIYKTAKTLDLNESVCKQIKKILKNTYNREEVISQLPEAEEIINNLFDFNELKEQIINNTFSPGFNSYINGEYSIGEGFVINKPGREPLKLVSDEGFTKVNKEHMKSIKEKIINNGETVVAWSSSKDTQLFNYYLNKNLEYGLTGGSNYGFATYLVTEPPFTEGAQVGYSDEYRRKLYGDNIFEFEIPTDRIIFFDYAEYKKTKKGQEQNGSFDNFIKLQIEDLGVKMTDEELLSLKPSDPTKTNSTQGLFLFKILSRYFYQGHRGNLRTPIDGFQYRGRNDGNTLVVWNSNRLIPRQFSNDLGQTWNKFDQNTPEFIEYKKAAERMIYSYNEDKYQDSIFDGNKTLEKKQIYRLLMAFNSNDGIDAKGKPINQLSDGIFYNIVIHDDKTIDASFKYNLPYVDYGKHFYRLRQNQFIDEIISKGYRFGKLNCGIKIGSEKNPNETWESVKEEWWPIEVSGGLKLVNLPINNKQFKCNCKLGEKTLYLTKCEIQEDVFDDWNVELDPEKPNLCSADLKEQLVKKYDWAKDLEVITNIHESRIKKFKEANKLEPVKNELENIVDENNLELIDKSHTTTPTENFNQAVEGNKLHVRKELTNPVTPRVTAMNNVASNIEQNPEIDNVNVVGDFVNFETDNQNVSLRFHLSDGEKNGKSNNINTDEFEKVWEHLISKDYLLGFNLSKEELLKYIKSYLNNIAPGIDNWYNNDWYKSFMKITPVFRNQFKPEDRENLIADSWEEGIGLKFKEFIKRFEINSYKKWTVIDTWVYPLSKETYINEIFNKNYNSINEFNSELINLIKEQSLIGISLKCKGHLKENNNIIPAFQNLVDISNDVCTFNGISGFGNQSIYINNNWITLTYRNSDSSKNRLCRFSILDSGSQRSYCSYEHFVKFCEREEIQELLNDLSLIVNNGISSSNLKFYIKNILESNIIIDDNSKMYLNKYFINPELFEKEYNTGINSYKYKNVYCQLIYLAYMLSKMTSDERNVFCTKVYNKCNNIGKEYAPYLFIKI